MDLLPASCEYVGLYQDTPCCCRTSLYSCFLSTWLLTLGIKSMAKKYVLSYSANVSTKCHFYDLDGHTRVCLSSTWKPQDEDAKLICHQVGSWWYKKCLHVIINSQEEK